MKNRLGVLKRTFAGRKKELAFLFLCALLPLAGMLPQHTFDWIVAFPIVGIYLVCAWLAGSAVLAGWDDDFGGKQVRAIFRTLTGFGIFSLYFLLLGVLGLARHLIISYVVLIFILSILYLFKKQKTFGEESKEKTGKKTEKNAPVPKSAEARTAWNRIASILIKSVLIVSLAAVFLLAPLPEGYHDSLLYHLAIPQQMFVTGSLTPMLHNFTTYLPLGSEMLYLPLAANDYAARLLQFAFAMMIFGLVYYSFQGRERMIAGLVCISGFAYFEFLRASVTVLPEINVAAYAIAGWLMIERFIGRRAVKYLAVAGIMFGFAAGAKYQGLVAGAAGASALLFVSLLDKKAFMRSVLSAGLVLLMALAVFSPWMIRSLLLTGDPVFPSGHFLFGAGNISDEDIAVINSIWSYRAPEAAGIAGFLTMPFREAVSSGGTASLLLLLVPLPFLLIKRKEGFSAVAIALLFFYVVWWFLAPHPRYFVPAVPLILLIGARGAAALPDKKAFRTVFAAVIAIVFAINFIPVCQSLYETLRPFEFYKSGFDRPAYEQRLTTSPFAAFNFLNEQTPKNSKILLIGESRGYNLRRSYHASSPYERQLMIDYLEQYKTAPALRSELKKAGYEYILVNFAEWKRTRDALKIPAMNFAPQRTQKGFLFIDLLRSLTSVYSDKNCSVYRL